MEFFRKTLDPVIALGAIAVLDIFLFLLVGAWTVGGGETMMTGLIAQFFIGDSINQIPFWQEVFKPDAGYSRNAFRGDRGSGCKQGVFLAFP